MSGQRTAESAILGRDAELASVATALSAGRCRGVVLVGPAGIGKTTVWRAACAAAREDGWRALVVRPRASEADMPFAALQDLLAGSLDEVEALLPAPQRDALDVALLRAQQGPTAVDGRVVAAAVRTAFGALAARGPLLICVDDWQWLDAPSAEAVRFALRRLSTEQVRVLATWRSEAGLPQLGLDAADLHRTQIAPLPAASLRTVVSDQLGQRLSRSSAQALHAVSGGNPFYALEIARARPGGDYAFDRPLRLDDVRSLVGRRFVELPSKTITALGTLAAMSDPDVPRVREVLADESVLDVAFEVQILSEGDDHRIEFTHPLLAAAAYAVVPPRRRREIHTALARHASTPEERARHLALATVGPNRDAAADIETGAVAAAARGAPSVAARLNEIAARLTPPEDAMTAASRRLAAAQWYAVAGDLSTAVSIWTGLAEGCPPGEVHAEAIAQLAWRGVVDHERAVALSEQAVAESTTVRDGSGESRCTPGWCPTAPALSTCSARRPPRHGRPVTTRRWSASWLNSDSSSRCPRRTPTAWRCSARRWHSHTTRRAA